MARERFTYLYRNVPVLNLRIQADGHTTGEKLEPWGPVFDLYPRFMSSASPLWGQEDFCASFKVNLERFLLPAHFVLEYWSNMADGAPRP